MTDQPVPPEHDANLPVPYDDVIDPRLIARSLWRGRWWIVGITILGALAGLGISLLSTSYQSRGLFLTPGVSVGDYKTYSAALKNLPRWQYFIKMEGKQDSPVAARVGRAIASPDASDFGKMVSPVFAVTETEAKQLGLKIDATGTGLVGLDITLKQDPQTTTTPLVLLADYVRTTVIHVDLQRSLQNSCASNRRAALALSNKKLQNAFAIQQNEQRRDTLQSILARLPTSAKTENQQVIAMDKGNDRFLSPVTQLVGVEVAISNQKLANAQSNRDLAAARLKSDYYCKASDALDEPKTGKATLTQLDDIRKATFANEDMGKDIVRQTANALQIQSDSWADHYLNQMRFVASPKGADTRMRKPGLVLGTALGAVLGGLLGALLALFGNWWRDNRDIITAAHL